MASKKASSTEAYLRDRVRYFLTSPRRGRQEVASLVKELLSAGDVVVFGGMLRDLMLHGNAGFESDVDLVLVDADRSSVAAILEKRSPVRNRFGGYRLRGRYWHLDIWHLEDTFAFRHRHVSPMSAEQLVRTTFFTWDAAAYSVATGDVWLHERFEHDISARLLDVNLAQNPNLLGMAVRAMRFLVSENACFSMAVAEMVCHVLHDFAADEIVRYECKSFAVPILTVGMMDDIKSQMIPFVRHGGAKPYSLTSNQYSMDLPKR